MILQAIERSIHAKIALTAGFVVLITALLVGLLFFIASYKYVISNALDSLEVHLQEKSRHLLDALNGPKEDLLFLSVTPPIKGIVRAAQSNGIDKVDNSTLLQWRKRMESLFTEMMRVKKSYLQIRFIGVHNGGREIVRVNRIGHDIFPVASSELQVKAIRDYFVETTKIMEREVYISKFELNREYREIVEPHQPVVRVSTPIFDFDGKIFGIIIINIDFNHFFREFENAHESPGVIQRFHAKLYMTNEKGNYLVHPDQSKTFVFETGAQYRLQDEYPIYDQLLANTTKERGARATVNNAGVKQIAYLQKMYFDVRDPERYLGLALVADYDDVIDYVYVIRDRAIFLTILLIIFAIVIVIYLARMMTRDLSRITAAVSSYASGDVISDLPIAKKDEIGALARSFDDMIQKIRQRDQDLHDSEQQFSGIIELADEGIISIDQDSNIILFNDGAEKIFGYKKNEIIGASLELLLPESMLEVHKNHTQEFMRSKQLSKSMNQSREIMGRRKNGELCSLEASLSKNWIHEKCIFTVVLRDVTQRLRSQEKLLLVQNNLSEAQQIAKLGSYTWNLQSDEMEWSLGLYKLLGIEQNGEVPCVKDIINIIHPDDHDGFIEYCKKIRSLQHTADFCFRGKVDDQNTHSYIMRSKIKTKSNGETKYTIGTIQDITDQLRKEDEKRSLENQLQQSQKMEAIGQLTGGIAHDFNNILAAMMGYVDLARLHFSSTSPKLADYLEQVNIAGNRARDLIAQMLAFSRGSRSEPINVPIAALVDKAVALVKSTIPSSIEVNMHNEENLPSIVIDPVQLHQVVMNLCINSRDAMKGRGILDISLSLVQHEGANVCCSCRHVLLGEFVELRISDNGEGILPDNLQRIFDPFFTTKEVGKGTGMGLSMVHGLVHDHDGHILVESHIGKGTVFQLLFPVTEQTALLEQPAEIAQTVNTLENIKSIDGSSKHIFVIDDDVAIASFLEELFEMQGYQVSVENDSVVALQRFESNPSIYDLVITDQTMPKLTGAELSKRLLQLSPDLPIILCTGYSDVIDEASMQKLGVKSYQNKPLDPIYISNTVASLITIST